MSAQYAKDQAAGFSNRIERVAIVGSGGRIGGAFTRALLKTGKHRVTAITRPDSTTPLPEGVHVARANYDDPDAVAAVLKGHDFFIITLSARVGPGSTAHDNLCEAAKRAGIKYVMPNCYGNDCRPEPLCTELGFTMFKHHITEVQSRGMTCIMLCCGYWYEWSLGFGETAYGIDMIDRKVTFFDKGEVNISTSTWEQCGAALAAALSLPILPQDASDESATLSRYFNDAIFIESFNVNQQDMFESCKRVTGTTDADWKIEYVDTYQRWKTADDTMKAGFDQLAFVRRMYTRVFFPGGPGDNRKSGLQNEVLGLPKEDLDEKTLHAIDMVKRGEIPRD